MPSPRFSALATLGLCSVVACFDPESPSIDTVADTGNTTGSPCEAGTSEPCTCEDGSSGTRSCLPDGSAFDACECGGADSSTADATVDPTVEPTSGSTGVQPRCSGDDDCADLDHGECEVAVCEGGGCVVQPADAGVPCGDDTADACTAADACDGAGVCASNDAVDGLDCDGCDLGVCACNAGACGDCDDFAPFNHFNTARSIAGWNVTGGWGLYLATPQNSNTAGPVFDSQVFGTDGNRVAPYPGSETETSFAQTRPTLLPATLEFLSWHVDEGTIDTKAVSVSVDGGVSFVPLADCQIDASPIFCQGRADDRAANDWDAIALPVPADMVGQVGIVQFNYNTQDPCCGFERGWFLDALNFATECECTADEGCADLGGECGAPVCGATGECELDAVAAGTPCGDATAATCTSSDACDGIGFCAALNATNGLTTCQDCDAGLGSCATCLEGECPDCVSLPINDFNQPANSNTWFIEDLGGTGADWQIYFSAPQSTAGGSVPTPLAFAPSFGTDGNRQAPYPGTESEFSRVTTPLDTVPAQITFSSWNVDEGAGVDNKVVEISVDGGATWTVLVDCGAGIGTVAFCNYREDPRGGEEWDDIVIDTAGFAGMVGQLRFTYNTVDSCCGFERGWFIDNLSFAEVCADPVFP